MEAYYERIGPHTFRATHLTQGAWSTDEQHIAPSIALMVHEIERDAAAHGRPPLLISRVAVDILGVLPIDQVEVHVEVLRPGRTIELVEAVLAHRGRPAAITRAWRLVAGDTAAVAGGGFGPALPNPEDLPTWPMSGVWRGDFIASLDVRAVGEPQPGRATVWIRPRHPLIDGEEVSDVVRSALLWDCANGIASWQPPTVWAFPNVDLSVHLFRLPRGEWVGLDATVQFGPTGQGLTSAVLHDLAGPIGTGAQVLTVRGPNRAG